MHGAVFRLPTSQRCYSHGMVLYGTLSHGAIPFGMVLRVYGTVWYLWYESYTVKCIVLFRSSIRCIGVSYYSVCGTVRYRNASMWCSTVQ